MSGHLTFNDIPKVNDCNKCQGTGLLRWYNLDGGPYYSWMKPEQKACDVCKGVKSK